MSKINKYVKLISSTSTYGTNMKRLSNRIFGEVVNPATPSAIHQVVGRFSKEPNHVADNIINWYPRHEATYQLMKNLRKYGLFRDEHEDFKDEMKRLRKLRGAGKTQKFQGKQAKKEK